MAEPKAEERGTLRGPPLFRSAGGGHKGHKSPKRAVAFSRFTSGQTEVRGSQAGTTTSARRVEALTMTPLMVARMKERGMHDIYGPQRTTKSHPCKTPGQRVHGWSGGIRDGRTNLPSLLHDQEAPRSAEVTKHLLRGFMVAARGVFMVATELPSLLARRRMN
jgi:hypothetical protein